MTSPGVKDAVEATRADFVPYRSAFGGFHLADAVKEDNAEELLHNVYVDDNEAVLRAAEAVAAQDPPDAVVMRRDSEDAGGVARAADAIVEHLESVVLSETSR